VKALPTHDKPEHFSGAVGSFRLKASVLPEEALPGDVVTIRTEVIGTGLLETVSAPILKRSADLKVYDAKRISVTPSLVHETQVVPLTRDALTLPVISFTFFDPKGNAYRTVQASLTPLKLRTAELEADKRFAPQTASTKPHLPGNPLPLSTVAAGIAALVLAMALAIMRARQTRSWASAASILSLGLLLATGCAYLHLLREGHFQRDVYFISSHEKGMSAPSAVSLQIVAIPSGSYVTYKKCGGAWALVDYGGRDCWVQEKSLNARP
jgi:hypothetical protein